MGFDTKGQSRCHGIRRTTSKRLEALMMKENRKPACVTTLGSGNTVMVVSAFFKEDSNQTVADKISRVLEQEAELKESVNLTHKSLKR